MRESILIQNDDFSIQFLEQEHRVIFKGTIRLKDHEYDQKINNSLISFSSRPGDYIVLDLSELEYLHSCGIASLSVYLTQMKNYDKNIRIVGSSDISWQVMCLDNFPLCNSRVEIVMQ